jgi:hypothetical protein
MKEKHIKVINKLYPNTKTIKIKSCFLQGHGWIPCNYDFEKDILLMLKELTIEKINLSILNEFGFELQPDYSINELL